MKKKLFLVTISIILSVRIVYGFNDTLYTNTLASAPMVDLIKYCSDGDSIVIIAPVSGTFNTPGGANIPGDRITILKSSLAMYNGDWGFSHSGGVNNKAWQMYFVSPMLSYWNGMSMNYCGQPTMVLTPQPDSAKASIVWSSPAPSTDASITVPQSTTDIWYIVKATNACNTVWDSIHIIPNPNVPNLGTDDSVCAGVIHTLDAGSGYDYYVWSTGANTQTIQVNSNGTYKVSVTDLMGCVLKDEIQVTFFEPTSEEICYVEFDTLSGKNNIVFPTAPANADSIKIYKEVSLNLWNLIGTLDKNITNFIDINSYPQNQSYSYKITVVDTCGNESDSSTPHTTITLLSMYDENTNTYGFTWSKYNGLSVSDYNLYGILPNSSIVLLGTVPGNQFFFNLVNPNPAFVKFFVAFFIPSCSNKTDYLVKSNLVSSFGTGIDDYTNESINVFPNPTHDRIYIQTSETSFETEIINVFGQVVLKSKNKSEIDISSLPAGSYILRLTGKVYSGQKSFIVY